MVQDFVQQYQESASPLWWFGGLVVGWLGGEGFGGPPEGALEWRVGDLR